MSEASPDLADHLSVELVGSRFDRVVFGAIEELREVDALVEAFDRAYSRAVLASLPPVSPVAPGAGSAGLAGPLLLDRPAKPTAHVEPRWDLIAEASRLAPDGSLSPSGRSDNDCLGVRLDPGSSRGRLVDVDPGWLRQATAARLSQAVRQAFDRAYDEKDHA